MVSKYGGIDEPYDGAVPFSPGLPGDGRRFAQDADLTIYWPYVRPCWEERNYAAAGPDRDRKGLGP